MSAICPGGCYGNTEQRVESIFTFSRHFRLSHPTASCCRFPRYSRVGQPRFKQGPILRILPRSFRFAKTGSIRPLLQLIFRGGTLSLGAACGTAATASTRLSHTVKPFVKKIAYILGRRGERNHCRHFPSEGAGHSVLLLLRAPIASTTRVCWRN